MFKSSSGPVTSASGNADISSVDGSDEGSSGSMAETEERGFEARKEGEERGRELCADVTEAKQLSNGAGFAKPKHPLAMSVKHVRG